MTRGIHLKRIETPDLELLGLNQEIGPGGSPVTKSPRARLLAEVDPTLSRVIDEVREGLLGTQRLLEEALGSCVGATSPEEPRTQ